MYTGQFVFFGKKVNLMVGNVLSLRSIPEEIWASNQQSILLGLFGTGPRMLKGRPAQTNRNKGPGRDRSKPLRPGDQTKAMTADRVMGRVRGSRRDPRKDEYGKISRRYRRHNWKDNILVEMESLEMESGDGDPSTLPRPRARRRQFFNSDQLMSILMMALASSVETAWRGSVDSFYLGQEGSAIKFGVLNAKMGLSRMDVWRCSVSLRARIKLLSGAKKVVPSGFCAMIGQVRGVAMNPVEHPHGGGNHQHIGHASTVRRDALPGQKVGLLADRRTGRLRGQAAATAAKADKCA
ncbi:ribosomal protein L2 family [Actinidia rufa]|uniref:Ribosomal protein L2 family n=1 Tax=Actinidia rufa TaxID=165716 RepID=A0A7J0G9T1_9ERIC|nr:ribosomal protein L2 family [Actinidia rufa]